MPFAIWAGTEHPVGQMPSQRVMVLQTHGHLFCPLPICCREAVSGGTPSAGIQQLPLGWGCLVGRGPGSVALAGTGDPGCSQAALCQPGPRCPSSLARLPAAARERPFQPALESPWRSSSGPWLIGHSLASNPWGSRGCGHPKPQVRRWHQLGMAWAWAALVPSRCRQSQLSLLVLCHGCAGLGLRCPWGLLTAVSPTPAE